MSFLNRGRAVAPPAMDIELQELPPRRAVTETRARSGSFDGTLVLHQAWTHTGTVDYHYSATEHSMDVRHIQSHAPGTGAVMMQAVEARAREVGASHMVTATSRPGFFRKSGFAYTEQQLATNVRKEAQDPGRVARDEDNRGQDGGGGYSMFKPL